MIGYKTVRHLAELGLECTKDSLEQALAHWRAIGIPDEHMTNSDKFKELSSLVERGVNALEVMDEAVAEIKELLNSDLPPKKIVDRLRKNINNE